VDGVILKDGTILISVNACEARTAQYFDTPVSGLESASCVADVSSEREVPREERLGDRLLGSGSDLCPPILGSF
jgi:hypothetical protein